MEQLLVSVTSEHFIAGCVFERTNDGAWLAIQVAPILKRHFRRIARPIRHDRNGGYLVTHFQDFELYLVKRGWSYEATQVSKK